MGNNPRVFWKDGEYIEDTKENRQAIRITELEQQLNEAKAGWDSAISDLYAAAEIAKGMQSQLDAKWISVEERLPELTLSTPNTRYSECVLVLSGGSVLIGDINKWRDEEPVWSDNSGYLFIDPVTHWQALPPPPSGAKEKP